MTFSQYGMTRSKVVYREREETRRREEGEGGEREVRQRGGVRGKRWKIARRRGDGGRRTKKYKKQENEDHASSFIN
jgi:hypothetical protein